MTSTLNYRFLVRRGTKAMLAAVNDVPLAGEIVFETDQGLVSGLLRLKMGDGTTHYNSLPYMCLAPLATKGDLLVMTAAGPVALPVAPDLYSLVCDAASTAGVKWVAPGAAGIPLTTKGDLLGFDTAPHRFPIGLTTGDVLTIDPTSPFGFSWKTPSTASLSIDTEVLADNPLGYWKLSETSGTTAVDSSTNGNNGTYSGGVTFLDANGRPGRLSGGVLLNGVNGVITVPAISGYNVTSNWSAEAWAMPASNAGSPNFITERFTTGSNPVSWAVGINVSTGFNTSYGGAYYTGTAWQNCPGSIASPGELAHCLVTFDGTNLRFYQNGVMLGKTTPAAHVASNDGIVMGAGNTAVNNFFGGILANCALYGTTLSAARVRAHYLAGAV